MVRANCEIFTKTFAVLQRIKMLFMNVNISCFSLIGSCHFHVYQDINPHYSKLVRYLKYRGEK
jgi:hypothetical protein